MKTKNQNVGIYGVILKEQIPITRKRTKSKKRINTATTTDQSRPKETTSSDVSDEPKTDPKETSTVLKP